MSEPESSSGDRKGRKWWFGRSAAAIAALAALVPFILWVQGKWVDAREYRILVPLYSTSAEYLDFMNGVDMQSSTSYSRKAARDVVLTINATKAAWLKGKEDALSLDRRIEFFFFPEGTNDNEYRAAFGKATDTDRTVVAAIGHVTSTVTMAYGKLYGEAGIPLVAPMATATDVPHSLRSEYGVPAVLRLPPSNKAQAEFLAACLLKAGDLSSLILRDLSNPTYSLDLVAQFRTPFVRGPIEAKSEDIGRILGVAPIGDSQTPLLVDPNLALLGPSAILFFGMTEPSLEALIQLSVANVKADRLVFTDGAVDESLRLRLRNLVSSKVLRDSAYLAGKKVYMTFPLPQPLAENVDSLVRGGFLRNVQPEELEMTHATYILDAAQVLLILMRDEVLKSGYPWRAKKLMSLRLNKFSEQPAQLVHGDLMYYQGVAYYVDPVGSTTDRRYYLYSAVGPGFESWNRDPLCDN